MAGVTAPFLPAAEAASAADPSVTPEPSAAPAPDTGGAAGSIRPPVELDDATIRTARAAAETEAADPTRIGDLVSTVAEDSIAVTVSFAATDPGYRGWAWCVTLALVEPGHPTVSEVVMLPGRESLLAPAWVPWDQRLRAGDLGVGDLQPPRAG